MKDKRSPFDNVCVCVCVCVLRVRIHPRRPSGHKITAVLTLEQQQTRLNPAQANSLDSGEQASFRQLCHFILFKDMKGFSLCLHFDFTREKLFQTRDVRND